MSNFFTDNAALERVLRHPALLEIAAMQEGDFGEASRYDFAPRNIEETLADYREIMLHVGGICGDVIAPNARAVDLQGPRLEQGRVVYAEGTQENHRRMVQAGLYGMTLERCFGGLNLPMTLFVMASELVARADGSFACLWALQNCAETIAAFGSEEQKQRYLPQIAAGATCSMDLTEPDAGSDLQAASLRASWCEERQCWLLNGVKRFITNGDADLKLVLARSEPTSNDGRGLSLFLVARSSGGVRVRRLEKKLGIRGSATCELVFEDAPAELLGTRRLGLIRYVASLMNAARLGIGAQAVGIAEAALREAEAYAAERRQFGKPIHAITAVAAMLTRMRTHLCASRTLLYATARQVDLARGYSRLQRQRPLTEQEAQHSKASQLRADLYTPLLKLMAGESCNRIAYDALQIFGGAGYMQDFPIERLYRDARVVTIYEGTSQMQVVAAMKYVGNGTLSRHLHNLLTTLQESGRQHKEVERLHGLVTRYDAMVATVEQGDGEGLEFHARRIVECGAMALMSLLGFLETEEQEQLETMCHYLLLSEATFDFHERIIGVEGPHQESPSYPCSGRER